MKFGLFSYGNDIISNLLYPCSFLKVCSFNRNSYFRYHHKNISAYQSGILIDNTDPQVTDVLTPIVFHSPQNHNAGCRLPFRKSKF